MSAQDFGDTGRDRVRALAIDAARANVLQLLHQALGELQMLSDNARSIGGHTTIQPYVNNCVADLNDAIKELTRELPMEKKP